jgi:tetratricopeptide (TPR) repeat protein
MRAKKQQESNGPARGFERLVPGLARIGGLVLAAVVAGCASGGQSGPVTSVVATGDKPYLVSPTRGYPLALDAGTQQQLDDIHRTLVVEGEPKLAHQRAERLLELNPALHPASVLAAQADFVAKDFNRAIGRMRPIAEEMPDYVAAQLLLGRSSEKTGDIPRSFAAYLAVSDVEPLARERADEMRSRAIEIMANRINEALDQGRLEQASLGVAQMQEWAPEEATTLQLTADVAALMEEPEVELEALRLLVGRYSQDRDLIERYAELELEAGDPSLGLRALQTLSAEYPDDAELVDKLALAKFRWRLQLLPEEIRQLAELPALNRSQLASLLFWLFPEVRYGRPAEAKIASDILDDPHREEIVRVINLGLMQMDTDLHQFSPDRQAKRIEVLSSLALLLNRHQPPLACMGEAPVSRASSVEYVCQLTARCGLLPSAADCLPSSVVSGATALEMCRRAQEQLGIR